MQNQEPATVTTKSGFTTKNACKDVPAESIERWYVPKTDFNFEDVVGGNSIQYRLQQELKFHMDMQRAPWVELGLPAQLKYLLYGPDPLRIGRLVRAFANAYIEQGGRCIRLQGADIYCSYVGVAEKIVQIAFREAMDNAPCLLIFEDVENFCMEHSANTQRWEWSRRNAFMQAFCELRNSQKPVALLCTTMNPHMVDSTLVDQLSLLRIPMLDREDRSALFEKLLVACRTQGGSIRFEDGFTVADMAAATEHYGYCELEMLCNYLRFAAYQLAESRQSEEFVVTRELFHHVLAEHPAGDKRKILEKQRAFEEAFLL